MRKIAGEPELIDAAADVAIAILEQIDVFLHPLRSDAPRNLLIDWHRRRGDRGAHGVVAISGLDGAFDPVPFEHVGIGITDYAGFKRDD